MILHTDRYFEHIYEVKHDMVCIKWPTIETLYLPEILNSVNTLVQNIKHYNIRHLLVDGSETQPHSSREDADKVVGTFISGLQNTRLEKLARVESAVQARESILKEMLPSISSVCPFEIRFFQDRPAALKWLENGHA